MFDQSRREWDERRKRWSWTWGEIYSGGPKSVFESALLGTRSDRSLLAAWPLGDSPTKRWCIFIRGETNPHGINILKKELSICRRQYYAESASSPINKEVDQYVIIEKGTDRYPEVLAHVECEQ